MKTAKAHGKLRDVLRDFEIAEDRNLRAGNYDLALQHKPSKKKNNAVKKQVIVA